MRAVIYISVFIGGALFCFLLISLGIIHRIDGIPKIQQEPVLELPTYLSFLSVMLTAVTAVLAALAIGIGIVAAYTFRDIKDEASKAAAKKLDEALSEEAFTERLNRLLITRNANPTVAELERNFDPDDDGNR
jgi:TRAP-type C4-dicarboxylate transport system permease small subunit